MIMLRGRANARPFLFSGKVVLRGSCGMVRKGTKEKRLTHTESQRHRVGATALRQGSCRGCACAFCALSVATSKQASCVDTLVARLVAVSRQIGKAASRHWKNFVAHTETRRHRVGATALKLGNCCAASLREPSTLMQTHWRKLHASTSMSSGFATAHQIGNRL